MESQCIGLAEALGLTPIVKRVTLRRFWKIVTPYLRFGGFRQFAANSDPLLPPWPDLLIASGRQSIAASLWVKKASGGRVRAIQLQNPGFAWKQFDLIVVPEHDRLKGPNVISTRGSLHRATPAVLAQAAEQWAPVFSPLPRPRIAVLIGGSNAAYRLGPAEMVKLNSRLAACVEALGGSLLITPSRRTGADAIAVLRRELSAVPHYLWDMQGENPYFGLLGSADFIVVTCDSVNMISEAASTGKPVYVEMLPGGSNKSARFLEDLRSAGLVREFSGTLAPYRYEPLDEVRKVVERVQQMLGTAGAGSPAMHSGSERRNVSAATNA